MNFELIGRNERIIVITRFFDDLIFVFLAQEFFSLVHTLANSKNRVVKCSKFRIFNTNIVLLIYLNNLPVLRDFQFSEISENPD